MSSTTTDREQLQGPHHGTLERVHPHRRRPLRQRGRDLPALPGVRSKAQYEAGAVVAVALAYGDSPAIIGEVQL
ncbi:MAG: hypothetical protein ACLVL7_10810 [Anaerotruncus massiliensis (ex Togo et al. 2019)]